MIAKAYDPKNYESDIYKKWEESGAFHHEVDESKEAFTVSMPPPNATGTLHLGHAVMLALEDAMVRFARMNDKCTLYLPGTDHAAIATQSVVEKRLQEKEGIANPRSELGREKLLERIQEFVEESKDTIRNQVRKMGTSCDWSREKYTLEEDLNKAVNEFFRRMYEDGLIYHGDRIVNWDPKMQTTVADDELEYVEEVTKFYYFQYGPVVIGTARPETKFADKIIIVHPEDERYKDLHHKELELEWINGPIKARVIPDECVDMEMGTGAMTITPCHSVVDFELAEKYDLDRPQIIDFHGHLNEVAGEFAGMHISEAREKIVEKLQKKGLVVKIDENYHHKLSVNYRGKGVIEPQIMKQWFIDVNKKVIDWKGKKMSIKEVMIDTVKSQMIEIIPDRFEKTYFHWIDNLRDWCISRQIWWGHQIPMWYRVSEEDKKKWDQVPESSSFLLQALNISILERKFSQHMPEDGHWIQDPDTLDTWFSSSLWTFSTLGWPEKTKELEYFHPTSVLETGYDILFFWVARMILASTYCLRSDGYPEEKCIPFKKVYLHGLIRDIEGKKMSKSRPKTCIDPLKVIEDYGADSLRLSLIIGGTPGNDSKIYDEKIIKFRNFVNKIWNSSRFVMMNIEDIQTVSQPIPRTLADKWICSRTQNLISSISQKFEQHKYSEAGQELYDFLWNEFCDWYLEISKEEKNEGVMVYVLKTFLKLIHPFAPYVTEALWHEFGEKGMIINAPWPKYNKNLVDNAAEKELQLIIDIIKSIRNIRTENRVEAAKKIDAVIYGGKHTSDVLANKDIIKKLARLESVFIEETGQKVEKAATNIISGVEIFIPLAGMVDIAQEKKRLEKEIQDAEKYVAQVSGKLGNAKFVENAPEAIVNKEREKLAEAQERLDGLKKALTELE